MVKKFIACICLGIIIVSFLYILLSNLIKFKNNINNKAKQNYQSAIKFRCLENGGVHSRDRPKGTSKYIYYCKDKTVQW